MPLAPGFHLTYNPNGNLGTIRTTDLMQGGSDKLRNYPLCKIDPKELESHILNDGDLLISRSGTCGIPCIFESQDKPIVAGAFLIRFQLTSDC